MLHCRAGPRHVRLVLAQNWEGRGHGLRRCRPPVHLQCRRGRLLRHVQRRTNAAVVHTRLARSAARGPGEERGEQAVIASIVHHGHHDDGDDDDHHHHHHHHGRDAGVRVSRSQPSPAPRTRARFTLPVGVTQPSWLRALNARGRCAWKCDLEGDRGSEGG
eukprot:scaffold347_cov380-Prasinococcus_capsulatus_cf.AAC.28